MRRKSLFIIRFNERRFDPADFSVDILSLDLVRAMPQFVNKISNARCLCFIRVHAALVII
jgi:hypothetical protein